MFRARAIVTILLLIFAIYTFAPAERKRRWLDKLRELGKSLVISLVIYWIYMLAIYLTQSYPTRYALSTGGKVPSV